MGQKTVLHFDEKGDYKGRSGTFYKLPLSKAAGIAFTVGQVCSQIVLDEFSMDLNNPELKEVVPGHDR